MDLDRDKEKMINSHLIARGIKDKKVLNIMTKIKRELFIPGELRNQAYQDNPLPIGCEQTISQPYIVAYMTECLDLSEEHNVLEIGTGSGYHTVILSKLAKFVYTVERIKELSYKARECFNFLGIENVKSIIGDGSLGLREFAPYDRIIVTAAAKDVPDKLINQLSNNGKLIIPVGEKNGVQELLLISKDEGVIHTKNLCYVRFVPLIEDHSEPN